MQYSNYTANCREQWLTAASNILSACMMKKIILHNKQLQINSASVCVSMQMKKNSIVFTALQLRYEKKQLFMALGTLDLR